jgi:hypothetical protein
MGEAYGAAPVIRDCEKPRLVRKGSKRHYEPGLPSIREGANLSSLVARRM